MVIFEGIVCCFLVLLCCAAGIANGPENIVFFYDQKVQDKAVELGLIDRKTIKKNRDLFMYGGMSLYFLFVIISVYVFNKARGFLDPFVQMSIILMIEGVFDRLFIDGYWVNHTKAWIIKGTEDLRPYIDKKTMIRKWLGTLLGNPLMAAIVALLMEMILK